MGDFHGIKNPTSLGGFPGTCFLLCTGVALPCLPSPSFQLSHTHTQLTHNNLARLFVWQAWHSEASASVLCGRRGTWRHRSALCVAGVALMALGWLARLVSRVLPFPFRLQLCYLVEDVDMWGYSLLYPLVNIQKAIEHCHRHSGFTHWKWWFSIVMLVYQRVILLLIFVIAKLTHNEHWGTPPWRRFAASSVMEGHQWCRQIWIPSGK